MAFSPIDRPLLTIISDPLGRIVSQTCLRDMTLIFTMALVPRHRLSPGWEGLR